MTAQPNFRRVMIVDDFAPVRAAIRAFLEQHRVTVVEAGTCAEAIEMLATERPDAVVLDYLLPDGTAFDVLDSDGNTPMIVLTAHASIDLAVRAIDGGAEELMVKPVALPQLQLALTRAMDWAERRPGGVS